MIYVARRMGSKAGHGIVKVPKLVCQVLAPPAAAYYHWRHSSFLWLYCRHQFCLFILCNLESWKFFECLLFYRLVFGRQILHSVCTSLIHRLIHGCWPSQACPNLCTPHQTLQNLQCIYTTCLCLAISQKYVHVYVTVDDILIKSCKNN